MKSLNTKLVLSALGIVAMLTNPDCEKRHHVSYVNESAVTASIPGYQSAVTAPIPGYDKDGGVVGIANPDQRY